MNKRLGALATFATWDEAGRLLFRDHEAACRYGQARSLFHGTRQRVRMVRGHGVPGYPWHVTSVPARELPATALVTVDACS